MRDEDVHGAIRNVNVVDLSMDMKKDPEDALEGKAKVENMQTRPVKHMLCADDTLSTGYEASIRVASGDGDEELKEGGDVDAMR